LVDEVKEKEESAVAMEPGEVTEAGTTETESPLSQEEELGRVSARLVELEELVASKESEIAGLKQLNAELEARLESVSNSLARAVASYKETVVRANPEVVEELITGDTIEAIDESVARAKHLVSKVRQGLAAEISLARIPAGAPERTSPDLSALSPREKIQYAIRGSP